MRVFFEGLEFYAYHGVPPEERVLGHRFIADLAITLIREPNEDTIAATVDYADAMKLVEELSASRKFQTVEALASLVADELMARYPLISELDLRIAKLAPPTPHIVETVGVEVSRNRR
jgi:dihydroneopterin aldolase